MSCAEMTSKVGVAHKISRALTRVVYLAPPTVNPGSAPVGGGGGGGGGDGGDGGDGGGDSGYGVGVGGEVVVVGDRSCWQWCWVVVAVVVWMRVAEVIVASAAMISVVAVIMVVVGVVVCT